jgi:hypothetical protein
MLYLLYYSDISPILIKLTLLTKLYVYKIALNKILVSDIINNRFPKKR